MTDRENEQRVVVFAPVANDANAMAGMLRQNGVPAIVAGDALHCRGLIEDGVGALLLTEEALYELKAERTMELLRGQPPWSELPLLILTSGGTPRLTRLLDVTAEAAGSITLLERPVPAALLLRSVRVALSARARQYQVRRLLAEQAARREELEVAKATLERELQRRRDAEEALGRWAEERAEPEEQRSWTVRYGAAGVALLLAWTVREAFEPEIQGRLPFATLFGAVAISIWFSGLWPTVVVAILGYAGSVWLFAPRNGPLVVADLYSFLLYAVGITLIIAIGLAMRVAQAQARANARMALERQRHAERALAERDQAEARARELDERLRVAVKNSRFVLAQCDADLRYTWIHNPHPDFTQVVGRRDDELDPGPEGRNLVALKQRVLATGRGVEADIAFQHPTELRNYTIMLEPMHDAAGRVVGITSAAFDISDRKRTEAALRQSEERARAQAAELEAIYESAPLGLAVIDRNQRFRRINRLLAEINGHTAAEHFGRTLHEMVPAVADEAAEALRTVLATGQPQRAELRGATPRDPDVERIWDERWSPLRNDAGEVVGCVVVVEDVTDRRRYEEALREAQNQIRRYAEGLEQTVAERTARLQETVQELEAFSYSIAHDMRAPLRAMIGFADILNEEHGASLNPTGRDHLRRIMVSARRLDRLIQDVLNYSRIVREDLPLEPVDVGQLVHEIVESYPNLTSARESISIDEALPVVRGNRAALAQVLSNLLDNALKFIRPDTPPRIRIFPESCSPPRPDAPGAWVRVCVEDNGIGIDPAVHSRLFQMFQRFTRPGLYEGTGIGLAIARKAVDRMGGVIGVDSEAGRGSRFWFVLPLNVPSVPASLPTT